MADQNQLPSFKLPVLEEPKLAPELEDYSAQVPDISQAVDQMVRALIKGPCKGGPCCQDRYVTVRRSEALAKGYQITP